VSFAIAEKLNPRGNEPRIEHSQTKLFQRISAPPGHDLAAPDPPCHHRIPWAGGNGSSDTCRVWGPRMPASFGTGGGVVGGTTEDGWSEPFSP
jgi:hypothetical protein